MTRGYVSPATRAWESAGADYRAMFCPNVCWIVKKQILDSIMYGQTAIFRAIY